MIGVGVLGLGVGEAHLRGYLECPDVQVVAACDRSIDRVNELKLKYSGVNFTLNEAEVLENSNIKIVSICTYDHDHFNHISRAIYAGKHVFVEKPIVLNRAELDSLESLLLKFPHLELSSNLILRRYPRFLDLKRRMESLEFGEVFHIEADYLYGRLEKILSGWRAEAPFYSVMHGGGVHMVDLVMWVLGQKVTQVMAMGNKLCTKGTKFKFNDFATALLRFEGGTIAKVSANFGCVHPHFHKFTVYGSKATFNNTLEANELIFSKDPEVPPTLDPIPYPGIDKWSFIKDFIDASLHRRSTNKIVSKNELFEVMKVCFAIEDSMNSGKAVSILK